MLMDKQNTFSDQQTIAAAAGTIVSTNSLDLGTAGTSSLGGSVPYDAGKGSNVEVVCQIVETVTSGGAATVAVDLVMSANADLSSPVVLQSTPAIALATLVAGYQFRIGGTLPGGLSSRYLGLNYRIATATTTAGKITAGLVLDRQSTSI